MLPINTSASAMRPFIPKPRDGELPRSSASPAVVSLSNAPGTITLSASRGVSPAGKGADEAMALAAQKNQEMISRIVPSLIGSVVEHVGLSALFELEKFCSTRDYVMPERYAKCAEEVGMTTGGQLHDMTRSAMQAYFKSF